MKALPGEWKVVKKYQPTFHEKLTCVVLYESNRWHLKQPPQHRLAPNDEMRVQNYSS